MRFSITLLLYRLLLPGLFLAAFPGWVVKMLRRGGLGSGLAERIGWFTAPLEYEPCGTVHLHAISLGESMLALKLIRQWLEDTPDTRFVLATGTSTGHALASQAAIPGLRVTYAPLDFRWMVRRYLHRFEPAQIVLIEGEVWPNFMRECARRDIPVRLVNARMSPRSARRINRFAKWLRPMYRLLDLVAIQDADDRPIWENLGLAVKDIHLTGSLKFDPGSGTLPARRPEFQQIIDHFGPGRTIVLAASTHPGEEALIAAAIRDAAPTALPVIVPRHAERRLEVKADLTAAGFIPVLRSAFQPTTASEPTAVLVVDTTGELRDWTAHADVVIIGKSFRSDGGQNPAEAILAAKPVISGPHMENFQPLVSQLVEAGGLIQVATVADLPAAIATALDPTAAATATSQATAVLARHHGATRRILALLTAQQPR